MYLWRCKIRIIQCTHVNICGESSGGGGEDRFVVGRRTTLGVTAVSVERLYSTDELVVSLGIV